MLFRKLFRAYLPDNEILSEIEAASCAVKQMAFSFSLVLLLACPIAAVYTGETGSEVLAGFVRILSSPCPLVTDYFRLGNLASALLNAGLCGMICALLMIFLRSNYGAHVWAGFFLVIGLALFGLNVINMWPPILGVLLYCRIMHISFRDNLAQAMFSTAFGPFASELLFRYPLERNLILPIGPFRVDVVGLLLTAGLMFFLSFAIPAMLPGAQLMHRGFNLFNGGLAFGLLGLFMYAFMYRTMGITPPAAETAANAVFEAHGCSYMGFCNVLLLVLFGGSLLYGWWTNGRSFRGYRELLQDTGLHSLFLQKYGVPCTWINLGVYGLMMLGYFDLVLLTTEGAGFTGATCGVVLAAMTFSAAGQHPRNVLPVIGGYLLLSAVVTGISALCGRPAPWSLSTQSYITGIAFATGLCPFSGCYGAWAGVAAGVICAIMGAATSPMHGGFMLYNGGMTAGLTALILLPLIDHYSGHKYVE